MMDKNGEKAVFDTRNKRATGLRYAPTETTIMSAGMRKRQRKIWEVTPVMATR
jgi:hypothetical protein